MMTIHYVREMTAGLRHQAGGESPPPHQQTLPVRRQSPPADGGPGNQWAVERRQVRQLHLCHQRSTQIAIVPHAPLTIAYTLRCDNFTLVEFYFCNPCFRLDAALLSNLVSFGFLCLVIALLI